MAAIAPISLYVHVPFCGAKCGYCDFYSHRYTEEAGARFVDSIGIEWLLVNNQYGLGQPRVTTLYFGGGTPSLLSVGLWERMYDGLIQKLAFDTAGVEWTVECNPDSFSADTARVWLDMGVTRIAMGVQSLHDTELRLLGRTHCAQDALRVLDHPLLCRFGSVAVDLIYGLPNQSLSALHTTVRGLLSRPAVSHLSAYELTLHSGTPLGDQLTENDLPNEETVLRMMRLIEEECAAHGFERYEVSNYAKPGHRCRHNVAYWTHAPYRGLGPAAHSFLPPTRYANVCDTDAYCAAVEQGRLARAFEETLDGAALGREAIFLGLRTSEGISERRFCELTGAEFATPRRQRALAGMLAAGLIEHCPPQWRCTESGWPVADALARELADG